MAASNIDGSVEINVDMNVSDAEKELTRLKKKINDTATDLKSKHFALDSLYESIGKSREEMLKFKKEAFERAQIDSDGTVAYTPEDVATIQGMLDHLNKMHSQYESLENDIRKNEALLNGMKQSYGEIAKEHAPALAFQKLGDGIKSVLSGVGKVAAVGGKAFAALGKGVLSVGKKIVGAEKNLNVFSKMTSSISGAVKRLEQMIKQAFVFTVVSKGLGMVREQLGSYLTVNKGFTEALAKVKGALLTAFQPIYDAVVPALTSLLNIVSQAINAVSQFTASLFGTTAKQVQGNAKALYNQAKATDKAGKSAEKASKSMASFDEVNQLQASGSDGGGGAGSTGGESPDFDYEFDDTPPFSTWGEAFSTFLDKIITGLPKLDTAFEAAAVGINGFSEKLLGMFTFPGVTEKVSLIGASIAQSLNGLVEKIKWGTLGKSLGAGINTALKGMTSFIYKFNWANFGLGISTLLNGAIEEIYWTNVGMFLWSGFKIAIETLAGFLLGLNIPALATAAANMASGFISSLNQTFASIDWGALGNQVGGLVNVALAFIHTAVVEFDWTGIASDLASFLNGTLNTVDWEGIGKTISDAFHGAIDFLTTAIVEFDWAGLGQSVLDFLKGIDWFGLLADLGTLIGEAFVAGLELITSLNLEDIVQIGMDIIGGVLTGIWNVISTIGTWLYDNVFRPIIDGFCDLFGIHSPSTVMAEQGNFIMQGLLGGITGMIDTVVGAFSGLWEKIKEVFSGVAKWFADHIINPLLGYYESFINFFIRGLNWLISKINMISFEVPDWVPGIGGKTLGFDIPSLSEVQLPRLAQGAVIPPNREFMAVLGDQKQGYNVEAPADLIRHIVREEVASAGVGRGEDIKIVFNGDLAALARVLNPHIEREKARVGTSFINGGMGFAR